MALFLVNSPYSLHSLLADVVKMLVHNWVVALIWIFPYYSGFQWELKEISNKGISCFMQSPSLQSPHWLVYLLLNCGISFFLCCLKMLKKMMIKWESSGVVVYGCTARLHNRTESFIYGLKNVLKWIWNKWIKNLYWLFTVSNGVSIWCSKNVEKTKS